MSRRDGKFSYVDSVSLRDYIESRLNDMDKATTTAYASMERRLESINEFRGQLKDQASTFVTRTEMNAKFDSLDKNRKDNTALIIAILSLLIGIISIIVRYK